MWPPWVKTRPNPSPHSGGAITRSPSFSFSFATLKGVQTLLRDGDGDDDDNGGASTSSPSLRVFHRVRVAASALRALRALTPSPSPAPDDDDDDDHRRVVLYFTSLRVVRKTFEDCRAVRAILRGIRAPVDERDLAMDPRSAPSTTTTTTATAAPRPAPRPPQLFVGARCLGGADEIRRLHESGDLGRLLDAAAAPPPPPPPPLPLAACELCGGARFVLCQSCSGSHKRYSEKLGFRSCPACNENGLARCPACCPSAV
ncbi:Uncharacterized protein ACMD2_21838 [Ananas comosus]|uniref:Glutaredoxin domain-containing protein n=1 Tax=Ananas comosus TaxID=4615 RepID=A0A199V8J6_ANACO|nr:Uncharacterized protein ACMD2_21838 [Ananas comosus]